MHTLQSRKLAGFALFFFFTCFAVATLRPGLAHAQAGGAGTVSSVSGKVQIQRGAATIPVTNGMPVQVGDRVITGDDGHVLVVLTDQSTLELGDSSNLVVGAHSGTATRVDLFGGVVRSFVNKTAGAAAPNFEVHTPNAVAAARGTKFDTSYYTGVTRPTYGDTHDFTDLSVYDGLMHFANINNPTGGQDVPAGYESTVAGMLDPTPPGPLGMTGAVSLGGSGGGASGSSVVSPVSGVPPPACPTCTGPAEGGVNPPPPKGQ
jgi:hypothetical protein